MGQDDERGNSAQDQGGRQRAPRWAAQLAYVILAAGIIVLAVVMTLRTVRHAREPVYALPPVAVATVSVAAALATCGAIGMVLVRRSDGVWRRRMATGWPIRVETGRLTDGRAQIKRTEHPATTVFPFQIGTRAGGSGRLRWGMPDPGAGA